MEDATGLDPVLVRSTRNVTREVRYRYPTRHSELYAPEIILEMGRRGGDLPVHLELAVSPMIAETPGSAVDVGRYQDLQAFQVRVLHPARTLWEKVVLVHSDVASGAWRLHADPTRFARHYGDIGALLGLGEELQALADPSVRAAIDADARRISARWYSEPEPCPKGGYADSPAFNPEGEFDRFLESSFGDTIERLWGPDRLQRSRECWQPLQHRDRSWIRRSARGRSGMALTPNLGSAVVDDAKADPSGQSRSPSGGATFLRRARDRGRFFPTAS